MSCYFYLEGGPGKERRRSGKREGGNRELSATYSTHRTLLISHAEDDRKDSDKGGEGSPETRRDDHGD